MKPSELLQLTLTHLWDGNDTEDSKHKVTFVCLALMVAIGRPINIPQDSPYWIVRSHITTLLGGNAFLETWLINNKFVTGYELQDTRRLQATRIAWVNNMIKHFKSKGM